MQTRNHIFSWKYLIFYLLLRGLFYVKVSLLPSKLFMNDLKVAKSPGVMHVIFTLLCTLLISQGIYANTNPVKWGKISQEEWELEELPWEIGAEAVVLCDFGVATFNGTKLSIRRHRRVKILSEKGLDRANVSIQYYHKDRIQTITGLKAQTLNLVDGKLKATKVESNMHFESDIDAEWKEKKFTFPAVAPGSIIEFTYNLLSENVVFLKNWNFQHDIPTIHSEFQAQIPQYLRYNVFYQGDRMLKKYSEKPTNRWFLKNVPALKPEPYMTALRDFREMISFQLTGYYASGDWAGQPTQFKTLMTTWEELARELNQRVDFGGQLRRKKMAQEILGKISLNTNDPKQRFQNIYSYFLQHYKWNGEYAFIGSPVKKITQERKGDSGDLGLLFTLLLKEAGLEAYPVLISTRDHGKIFKDYPLLSQFNHLLTQVIIDGKSYLVDPTDRWRPSHLLDREDLNYVGLKVKKDQTEWVDITPTKNNSQSFHISIDLRNTENPVYQLSIAMLDYYALEARKQIADSGVEAMMESFMNADNSMVSLQDISVEKLRNISEPLKIKCKLEPQDTDFSGERIYIQPVLLHQYSKNQFKSEKRYFPIDFGCPFKESFRVNIHLPEGYQVEEIPQNVLLKLPHDQGSLRYQISAQGKDIQVFAEIRINKPVLHQAYYASLREFYDLIISKFGEQIVLAKIN